MTAKDQALDFVSAVQGSRARLDELHRYTPDDRSKIAQTYDDLRLGMKLAEVFGSLAIAEQLERLNSTLEGWLTEDDPADLARPLAPVEPIR